ncbi:cullin-2-like [Tropilaelaps mercedesae]|uniref:Cullin-2-like n=1 Tax=Tropilaelaps mercedesae TaxID=418985 RepID=A0A1V9Y3F6_9ACAR|nr:cullin-2-like [Tropilaelaps mercedesae]
MKPKQLNFEDVWCELRRTVHGIMINTVSRESWYEGYLQVYHLCVATPESLADRLYSAMDQFLSDHVTALHAGVLTDSHSIGLLKAYYTHWDKYVQGVRYLDRLFYYLNHEWVKKKRVSEADIAYGTFEADELVLEIGELGLDIWMKKMLQPLQPERSNPNKDYVKGVVDSFVEVERFRKKRTELEFYRKFQARYLDATNKFYTSVSHGLIGNIDCSSFMEKVLHYVRQEELRSRKFLDSSSFGHVIKECERVMVGDHLDFIYNEARKMVAELNCKDLANMYILLKPLDNSCMQPLIKEVQNRIEKVGEQLLQDIDHENVPQSFVDSVLKVHDDYRELITKVFNSDQQFIAALDRACITIINSSHPKVNFKAPELLARYCDQILKRGPRAFIDQEELERRLSKSIIVFKYLDEKDHFQKSYSRVLAKRLIHGASASMESEELMINMLKQVTALV